MPKQNDKNTAKTQKKRILLPNFKKKFGIIANLKLIKDKIRNFIFF